MRLYILFLWLTNFLLEVVALNFAAPWEMFYFYSAYKTEWLAGLSGAGRTIATLCVHKDSSLSAGMSIVNKNGISRYVLSYQSNLSYKSFASASNIHSISRLVVHTC